MAKTMAVIANGMVKNLIWCADNVPETDVRIDPKDRPVGIGDTYLDGVFYRDGTPVQTPLEAALAELADAKAALELLGVTTDV